MAARRSHSRPHPSSSSGVGVGRARAPAGRACRALWRQAREISPAWPCSMLTTGERRILDRGRDAPHVHRNGAPRVRTRYHANGGALRFDRARCHGRVRGRARRRETQELQGRPTSRCPQREPSSTGRSPEEGTGRAALVWVDRNGVAAERALSDAVLNARDPRLSPDGRRLLLTTGPGGETESMALRPWPPPPTPLAREGNNIGRLEPRWDAGSVWPFQRVPFRRHLNDAVGR